jgi:hypothetical protein
MKVEEPSSGTIIAFLSFLDIIDRLDVLILEARHTQVNIVHQLRMPTLHRALRFEECFLWGGWRDLDEKWQTSAGPEAAKTWYDVCLSRDFDAKALAARAVIRLPPTPRIPNREECDSLARELDREKDGKLCTALKDPIGWEVRTCILIELRHRINRLWATGAWSTTQKRQYHILAALQLLKRDILTDKLAFFCHAFETFDAERRDPRRRADAIGHFLLLRTAFLARSREYVVSLGELQGQFNRDMDMGVGDQYRPMLERRREQGIYSGFLADFTRDIQEQIDLLFAKLSPKNTLSNERVVMHRWHHDFTSSNELYRPRVWGRPKPEAIARDCASLAEQRPASGEEGSVRPPEAPKTRKSDGEAAGQDKTPVRIGFVNTSYWMLERPDLQPAIAHEVAHLALQDRYMDLHEPALSVATDPLAELLRTLNRCLIIYQAGAPAELSFDNELRPRQLLKEIGADLIAVTVTGPAFVVALALEILGFRLEELFLQPDEQYDIELERFIDQRGLDEVTDPARAWYLRLHLACTWCELTQHRSDDPYATSKLERRVLKGVRDAADLLFDRVARINGIHPEADSYWRSLKDRLCTIAKTSRAAEQCRLWRKERGDDYSEDGTHAGRRLYPRSSRRLPNVVRNLLFERMLGHKRMPGQPLCDKNLPDAISDFDALYLDYEEHGTPIRFCSIRQRTSGAGQDSKDLIRLGGRPLFQHHYDIPWQCAVIRCVDFLHRPQEHSNGGSPLFGADRWPEQVHQHTSLGRALYQIGLEFHFWRARSSFHRFASVVRLLIEVLRDVEKIVRQRTPDRHRNDVPQGAAAPEVIAKIGEWLFGKPSAWGADDGSAQPQAESSLWTLDDLKHCVQSYGELLTGEDIAGKADLSVIDLRRLANKALAVEKALDKSFRWYKNGGYRPRNPVEKVLAKSCQRFVETSSKAKDKKDGDEAKYKGRAEKEVEADGKIGRLGALGMLAVHPGSPFRCKDVKKASPEQRFLEKLQGHKLKELSGLLSEAFNPGGQMDELPANARRQLRSIQGFLSMHAGVEVALAGIVKAFSRADESQDWRQVAPRVHLITRIYFSGSYLRLDDAELNESFGQKAWSDCCDDKLPGGPSPRSGRRYFPLLGMPDIISIQADRPMCRCPLPQFFTKRFVPCVPCEDGSKDEQQKPYRERRPDLEQFPNFFARRELALPLFLAPLADATGNKQVEPEVPRDILGVLSVTLKQRDLRLFLVHRLLNAVSTQEQNFWEQETRTAGTKEDFGRTPIEALGRFFKPGDLLLLGEGWGDLLILLAKPSDEQSDDQMERRMRDAFWMERILFQDFQVDRAELALSPDCVAVALKSDDFTVSAGLRFMEDRGISFNATDWQETVQRRIIRKTRPSREGGMSPSGDGREWDNECEVWRPATGRFDLVVRLIGNGKGVRIASYEDIASLFGRTEVDGQDSAADGAGFEFNTGLDVLETTIAMRCKNEN